MEIRELGEADAQAWWDLRLAALEGEPLAFGKAAAEHRATPIAVTAAQLRATWPEACTVGAFAGGALVAMATYKREGGAKERHKGGIYGVYVAPAHRRHGAARALVERLLAGVRREGGVEQVRVSVSTTQAAAVALYEALGWVSFGVEPRALKVGDVYVDEAHLLLRL